MLERIQVLVFLDALLDPLQAHYRGGEYLELRLELLKFGQVKNDHVNLLAFLQNQARVVFYLRSFFGHDGSLEF